MLARLCAGIQKLVLAMSVRVQAELIQLQPLVRAAGLSLFGLLRQSDLLPGHLKQENQNTAFADSFRDLHRSSMEVLLITSWELQVFLEPSVLTPADRAAVTSRLVKMHVAPVTLAQVNISHLPRTSSSWWRKM